MGAARSTFVEMCVMTLNALELMAESTLLDLRKFSRGEETALLAMQLTVLLPKQFLLLILARRACIPN
jgi:hypothetical protein